ncbi:hypothetical protein [Roseomonas harenae]|uniref:hypothetical protein n=1 Tax=Muricoccus harenae TaxID=2692566 RepID=UPI001331A2FE|nr:hypothetical protein [Roseomonas harenae]
MSDLSLSKTYGGSGIRHTPPKIKATEQAVAYNPFYMDLAVERPRLDPNWAKQPGIILNWLLRDQKRRNSSNSLSLGVEANNAKNMKNFMDKFCPGHGLGAADIQNLVMLGHPTLACKIRSGKVAVDFDEDMRKEFVGDLDNYSGILGGELHCGWKFFHGNCWYINYNSGRYGPQHLKKNDAKEMKSRTKRLFAQYCGVTVYD